MCLEEIVIWKTIHHYPSLYYKRVSFFASVTGSRSLLLIWHIIVGYSITKIFDKFHPTILFECWLTPLYIYIYIKQLKKNVQSRQYGIGKNNNNIFVRWKLTTKVLQPQCFSLFYYSSIVRWNAHFLHLAYHFLCHVQHG